MKFSFKFANIIFVLGIILFTLITIYGIYKIYHPAGHDVILTFYYISALCSGIAATLFIFGLIKLNNELKVNFSLMFVVIVMTVYSFETYLEFSRKQTLSQSPKEIAEQIGVPYDTRTKIEVLKDLNDSGIESYPNFHPGFLLNNPSTQNGLKIRNEKIYPLSGISNKVMVQSNENGYWMKYRGDKFGFHNPKDVYQNNNIDIVMIGDSFTEGWSVKSNENISSLLREQGLNVVNLGKGGNGPLLELATLKEYAEPLKPRLTLWLYTSSDLVDLKDELKSLILIKYLNEDNFSQKLTSKQDEIDSLLKNFSEEEWKRKIKRDIVDELIETKRKKEIEKRRRKIENNWAVRISKIYNLRLKTNLTPKPTPVKELLVFKKILEKSKKTISQWGGELYFVYLPSYNHYSMGKKITFSKDVLHIVNELDIPFIDIHTKVFVPHRDLLSLFPFRGNGHYNADGYRLVAEAINKRLKDDGITSSQTNN